MEALLQQCCAHYRAKILSLLIILALFAAGSAQAYEPPQRLKPVFADYFANTTITFNLDDTASLQSRYDIFVCELAGAYDASAGAFHFSHGDQSCDLPATYHEGKFTVGDDNNCRVACSQGDMFRGTFSGEYKLLKPECDSGYVLTAAQMYIESGASSDDAQKYLGAFSQTEQTCDQMLPPYVKSGLLLANAKAFAQSGDAQKCIDMYKRVEAYISMMSNSFKEQDRRLDESSFDVVSRYMTSADAFCKN